MSLFELLEKTPNTKLFLVVWIWLAVIAFVLVVADMQESKQVIMRDSFMRGQGYTWNADRYVKDEVK